VVHVLIVGSGIVKDVMIVDADRDWILRAKSGWNGVIGLWVGWVEHPSGPVFFALNIDTPNGLEKESLLLAPFLTEWERFPLIRT
jgi:beta-lactamase class D